MTVAEPVMCRHCGSTICRDCRDPYVGEGADGARRSAQIDREEADTFDPGTRRTELLISADKWEWQAQRIERKGRVLKPTEFHLCTVCGGIGSRKRSTVTGEQDGPWLHLHEADWKDDPHDFVAGERWHPDADYCDRLARP